MDESRGRFRILIAVDQDIWFDMLRTVLADEFDVMGSVTDPRSLIEDARRARPDAALIDGTIAMPTVFELGRHLIDAVPAIKIVYLTGKPHSTSVPAELLDAHKSSRFLGAASVTDLLRTMRGLAQSILGVPEPTMDDINPVELLSPRQREVLALLVHGLPMKSVARQLNITQRTVAFHKYRAMETLGLHGNADLVSFAVRYGLLAAT